MLANLLKQSRRLLNEQDAFLYLLTDFLYGLREGACSGCGLEDTFAFRDDSPTIFSRLIAPRYQIIISKSSETSGDYLLDTRQ